MSPNLVSVLSGALWLSTLAACSEHPQASEKTASPQIGQWINAMVREKQDFEPASLPGWPTGFSMHPQSQAESFELQAFLFPIDTLPDRNVAQSVGLITRMDRLALRPQSAMSAGQSAWKFDSVVRSSVLVDAAIATNGNSKLRNIDKLATLTRDQWVQRMALGLSGGDERTLWISKDKLEITLSEVSENSISEQCQRQYQWTSSLSSTDGMELRLSMNRCPQVQKLGPLVTWQQFAEIVTAVLVADDGEGNMQSIPLQGFGWLRHSWGNLINAEGAVLIDSLQIRLADQRLLNITRSKRRSGRGPKTVQATLQRDGLPETPIDMQWLDNQEQQVSNSGIAYPNGVTLRSVDNSIVLQVKFMNRLSESESLMGTSLHVPVQITGSHQGQGFLTFNSLLTDP